MSGKNNGVQVKVKEKYPNAHFVHCYAHQINLIMKQATSSNKRLKIFFANVEAFSIFFSLSPKRTAILDKILHKRFPRGANTR
jgi:hypothetical protein